MKILGISCFYHDSAVSIISDGKILYAAQEERFTRQKNDPHFPQKALMNALATTNLKLTDFEAIVYYEKPWVKFDRILESYIASAPWGLQHFVKSFSLWIKYKLFLKQELLKSLKKIDPLFDKKKLLFSEHHLSHAASAFYPSPFDEALVVTFDGVGEWATASVGVGRGTSLEILEEIHFPDSVGLLYSTLTAYCGFKVNSGEYKVMGLAPYGQPRFYDRLLEQVIHLTDKGSFELNLKYFDFSHTSRMHTPALEKLLGFPPRTPESLLDQNSMDLAASVQKLLEFVLLWILGNLQKKYNLDHLCLAGGVALNCVANSAIKKSQIFKKVWVQPVAGDAGGSWGAALAAHFLHFKNKNRESLEHSKSSLYLGPSYSSQEIQETCAQHKVVYQKISRAELIGDAVERLIKGEAVGWFQGAMEFGPRALGARSILADPRAKGLQKRLNLKIKFRESFRPFAPIVLLEDVSKYFENAEESPYMMFIDQFKKEWCREEPVEVQSAFGLERLHFNRSDFAAVTHLDYTARLQTLTHQQNPLLYEVMLKFKELTGHGLLVNTSFNVRGEPIVCSPQDALSCFWTTDLDVLYMEDICVQKTQNHQEQLSIRRFALD